MAALKATGETAASRPMALAADALDQPRLSRGRTEVPGLDSVLATGVSAPACVAQCQASSQPHVHG